MKHLRIEGFIDEAYLIQEKDDSRKKEKERKELIFVKSEQFNTKHNEDYFFVEFIHGSGGIEIGAFIEIGHNYEEMLMEYIDTIQLKINEIKIEEITLDTIIGMLKRAERNSFISNSDTIIENFDLETLSGISFGENLVEEKNKEELYKDAEKYLSPDLDMELDRIFLNKKQTNIMGHPVHYFIETDDHETRKGMYRLLLAALYTNGRILNKRYSFINFEANDYFSERKYDKLYKNNIGGTVVVRYEPGYVEEDDEFACDERENISLICETMKKYKNQVLTIICFPKECTQIKEMFSDYLGGLSIVEIKESFVYDQKAREQIKNIAENHNVECDEELLNKVKDGIGYLTTDLKEMFDDWYSEKLKNELYSQYKDVVSVGKKIVSASPKGNSYEELMSMTGIEEAKKIINQAINYYKAQKVLSNKGIKTERPSMHMIFTGNPGTAKTTVARLFSNILKDNGVLSRGSIVEVGRADLVGKFVGWTAPIIKKKFEEASGGVLFIDEAYSLVDDRNNSFGDEAINTIVQEMENHRNDMVVIFAGYPDKMEQFLQKNPGLKSRIAFKVPFPDYGTNELCDIANLMAKKKGLVISNKAIDKMKNVFDLVKKEDDFGNGRYVRNLIEQAKIKQACRLLNSDFEKLSKDEIITITEDDIEMPNIATKVVKQVVGF